MLEDDEMDQMCGTGKMVLATGVLLLAAAVGLILLLWNLLSTR